MWVKLETFCLFQSVDEWTVNDVTSWLAATSSYEFASMFIENNIDGTKLESITDTSLIDMGVKDSEQRQLLLLAIQELLTGTSETVSGMYWLYTVVHFSHASKTTNDIETNSPN